MSPSALARSLGASVLALPLAGLLWAGPVQSAQTLSGLSAEINQTERDLKAAQRDLLHLAQSYGVSDPNAIERRFAALEQEIQRLTGQIERLGFEQRQMMDRVERMQSDMEFRLSRLEGGNPAPSSSSSSSSGGSSGSFSSGGSGGSFAGSSGSAGSTQSLGSVSAQELQQLQGLGQGQTASVGQSSGGSYSGQTNFQTGALTSNSGYGSEQNSFAQPSTANLPAGSAEEQYNHAFGLLRKADYQGAEQALKAFIQSNPTDPLVANAKYWLGETYYVRGNYSDASQAFAQSYQDHPNGSKSADSLLKLGLSLSLLGRTNEACQVLQELQVRMGNSARANILNRGRREQDNLGC